MTDILCQTTMVVIECGGCGVQFAMTRTFYDRRCNDHKSWYCPAGCDRHYTGKSEKELLQEEVNKERGWRRIAEHSATSAHQHRREAERSAAAHKGHSTRLKNRISKGVCPCCRRTFANVQRHMSSQHPEFGDADE